MKDMDISEYAYKNGYNNGYNKGFADAIEFVRTLLAKKYSEIEYNLKTQKELKENKDDTHT